MFDEAAWFSEIGRRSSNQDSCAVWWTGDALFAAVADGLGGMPGGGHASRHVIGYLKEHAMGDGAGVGVLAATVLASHRSLQRLQGLHPEYDAMATTLTAVRLHGCSLIAAHSGDSRLYAVGVGGVRQLTEDHSEAQRLLREGRITPREFAAYPRKHILESALGVPGYPMLQSLEARLQPGDWVVVASDGAYNKLDRGELAEVGRSARTCKEFAGACRGLVEGREPHDNYTLVVVRAGVRRRPLQRVWDALARPRVRGNVPVGGWQDPIAAAM